MMMMMKIQPDAVKDPIKLTIALAVRLCFCCTRKHMKLTIWNFTRIFFTIFADLPPLSKCRPVRPAPPRYASQCVCASVPPWSYTKSLWTQTACGNFTKFTTLVQFGAKMKWLGFLHCKMCRSYVQRPQSSRRRHTGRRFAVEDYLVKKLVWFILSADERGVCR